MATKSAASSSELLKLEKEELVDRIVRLEAHVLQLKNIISKRAGERTTKAPKKPPRPFDFDKCTFRRIFLHVAYLGAGYRGLATQEDTDDTVEHHLFLALTKSQLIRSRQTANYHRCGRTDKGVSATGQVISLLVRSRLGPERLPSLESDVDELPYCRMLNRILPDDIRAVRWRPADGVEGEDPPSARFDCKYRTYKYWFPRGTADVDLMRTAARHLVGSHDFRNLCKMDVANGVTTYVRNVHSVEISPTDSDPDRSEFDVFCLKIVGNAFLWHQIRCIVGVLFLIGEGKERPDLMRDLLDIENHPRKPQYDMAADFPLNLFSCSYSEYCGDASTEVPTDGKLGGWHVDRENLTHVIKCFFGKWTWFQLQASTVRDFLENLLSLCDADGVDNTIRRAFGVDVLLRGVKSKTYVPLLKRQKCESLENRIDHYAKKRTKVATDVR